MTIDTILSASESAGKTAAAPVPPKSLPRAFTVEEFQAVLASKGMTEKDFCEVSDLQMATLQFWKQQLGNPSKSLYRRIHDAIAEVKKIEMPPEPIPAKPEKWEKEVNSPVKKFSLADCEITPARVGSVMMQEYRPTDCTTATPAQEVQTQETPVQELFPLKASPTEQMFSSIEKKMTSMRFLQGDAADFFRVSSSTLKGMLLTKGFFAIRRGHGEPTRYVVTETTQNKILSAYNSFMRIESENELLVILKKQKEEDEVKKAEKKALRAK